MRSLSTDPLRNFKFIVNIIPNSAVIPISVSKLGFMSVDGFGVQNEVIPYREGGDNTTTRKMPGQSDYGPITFARGSMSNSVGANGAGVGAGRNEVYIWLQQVFSVIEGGGTGAPGDDFRCDITVDVLEHPVTAGQSAAGINNPAPIKLRHTIYNAWPMAMNWSGLDAGGNAIIVESLQVAHEGFYTTYGTQTPGDYLPASSLPV